MNKSIKKWLAALTAVVMVLTALTLVACDGLFGLGGNNPPDTPREYVQWLIDNLKTTYNASANMRYMPNDSSMEDHPRYEELKDLQTSFDAYVTKDGNKLVSSVNTVTRDYGKDNGFVTESQKVEFTKTSNSYSKKVYDDGKRVTNTESWSEQWVYLTETTSMLLPETLLQLCLDTNNYIDLFKNADPASFDGSRSMSEEELKKFTVIMFTGGCATTFSSSYLQVVMKIVVYKNELSNIEFVMEGYDSDDNMPIYREGSVGYYTENVKDVFDKTGYYASEGDCVKAMLNGVIDNQPTTFQLTQTQKQTLDGVAIPNPTTSYISYEKLGDTLYYYTKFSQDDNWQITETYTTSGNGHIGRRYDAATNTYTEHLCDKDFCAYVNPNNIADQHTFINATNTSFVSFAQLLGAAEYAEVSFDKDGVCKVVIKQEDDQQSASVTIEIKDNKLQKMTVVTTTEIPPTSFGNTTISGTSVMTIISTYTYGTQAINADLSGFSKAQ